MNEETTVVKRNSKGRIPPYTVLKCRFGGRHQVGWCFMMCTPKNGLGLCGRQAPHSVHGRSLEAMRLSEAARKDLPRDDEGAAA